ncbi:hypothetical protein BSPWISOXPB_3396 [uncultured Gammaproteobacteria bacterium]|nr:hypothetical protein BSPWISOXPB_3396 [uncultured Gammaproteobacteria bacterium]
MHDDIAIKIEKTYQRDKCKDLLTVLLTYKVIIGKTSLMTGAISTRIMSNQS